MRRQRGFTLIEMVVVIIVTGILAAIALPRFAALQVDARTAKAMYIYGAMGNAANLARSAGITRGALAATPVAMEGANVTMANFYPTGNAAGIITAIQLNGALAAASGYTVFVVNATTIQARVTGATTPANCRAQYVGALAGGVPTITYVTTGC
jgi:MSHA pilin protein MshA